MIVDGAIKAGECPIHGVRFNCGACPCRGCELWVARSPHDGLWRVSTPELRIARAVAHQVFDRLWRDLHWTRGQAYEWMAFELGIPAQHAHIGHLSLPGCRELVRAVTRTAPRRVVRVG